MIHVSGYSVCGGRNLHVLVDTKFTFHMVVNYLQYYPPKGGCYMTTKSTFNSSKSRTHILPNNLFSQVIQELLVVTTLATSTHLCFFITQGTHANRASAVE